MTCKELIEWLSMKDSSQEIAIIDPFRFEYYIGDIIEDTADSNEKVIYITTGQLYE